MSWLARLDELSGDHAPAPACWPCWCSSPVRNDNGTENWNHIAYVGLSEQALEDALALLRAHPEVYATTFAKACTTSSGRQGCRPT